MNPDLLKRKDHYKNILSIVEESELNYFIGTFIRRMNPITNFYWIWLGLITVSFIFLLVNYELLFEESRIWVVGLLGGLLFVLLFSSVLNRLLQGLLLKAWGSKIVKVQFNWKKISVNVYSPDFAINKKHLIILSIFPFLIFSVIPLLLAFFADNYYFFAAISIAFFHSLYTMKDFALLSYLHKKPDHFIVYEFNSIKTLIYTPIKESLGKK